MCYFLACALSSRESKGYSFLKPPASAAVVAIASRMPAVSQGNRSNDPHSAAANTRI
jgi:hypothetical protein